MDTRTILQIILGLIATLILLMGGLTIYYMTRTPDTVVVKKVVREDNLPVIKKQPWEDKGSAAIALVKRVASEPERKRRGEPARTVEDVLNQEDFVREILKLEDITPQGWQAHWWGETKFGASFFVVRFAFKHRNTIVGPTWLVDLRTQKVVPKNVLAQVCENPARGRRSKYYDKNNQVLSTITNHRVEGGLSLEKALENYLATRNEQELHEQNSVVEQLGWTIEHQRGNLFKAYFQWNEGEQATHAEFEFDFDVKALKAVNLHAAQVLLAEP